jgi:hypothetical protein
LYVYKLFNKLDNIFCILIPLIVKLWAWGNVVIKALRY